MSNTGLDTFAKRLSWAMERKEKKAKHIAELLGTTPQRIYQILKDKPGKTGQKPMPDVAQVPEIARLLNVNPAWLLWGISTPEEQTMPGNIGKAVATLLTLSAEHQGAVIDLIYTLQRAERPTLRVMADV